jgi:cysteine desulfurase
MISFPIYLDNNATTKLDPLVLEAMMPYLTENYGNAASVQHSYGWVADEAVKIARQEIATSINALPQEIVLTSGSTESDNLAIKGVWEAYRSKGNHIITVKTEHKAVLDTCAYVDKHGGEITYLDVDQNGQIDLNELRKSIKKETILIAIMYANNETGAIQPINEIGEIAHANNILFFCDATQAIGKINVDVQASNIDLMAMSAHKIHGPKGVGALFLRRRSPRVTILEQMNGGDHESGRRSGTLNVPGIVGMGKAFSLAMENLDNEIKRLEKLRDELELFIVQNVKKCHVNGAKYRLPHVTNISFVEPNSNQLLAAFRSKLAVSAGSACTSAKNEPSYVLLAMGLGEQLANSVIRISLSRFTTQEEIDFAKEFIVKTVNELQS